MTIEVNSQQRADAVKQKISHRLGKQAVFRNALIQSTEKMLEEMQNNAGSTRASTGKENDDQMALPEVQEQLREMGKRHWNEWLDIPVPALKDQTPREAAQSESGRERLEALMLQMETFYADKPQPYNPDVDALRRALGLD